MVRTCRLGWVLMAVLLAWSAAGEGAGKPAADNLGAGEDALVLEEERTVETCYKIPIHVPMLQQMDKNILPLPEVGKSKVVGKGVWFREKQESVCNYPDQTTFQEFQAVRKRLSTAEQKN